MFEPLNPGFGMPTPADEAAFGVDTARLGFAGLDFSAMASQGKLH